MTPPELVAAGQEASKLVLSDPAIAGLLPFAGATDAELREVLSDASIKHIGSQNALFHEGDSADNFYILLDGVFRILRTTDNGEQVVVLHIAPGQMFGIAKAYDSPAYRMTAHAAKPSLALSWPSEKWDGFVSKYPHFKVATRKAIGHRINEMQDKIVEMATLRVEQRIAKAIMRLIEAHGQPTGDGVEIGFPITRQDLSEMTGTTLHSVSRYLSKWQREGIISSARRRIVVKRSADLPI